jgi:hypothetical protein
MSDRKLPDDRDLDDFLAGRSDLSRRYRDGFPNQAAPPELDQKILDLAAESIEREQRARKRAFVVPLSLAASVVVVFSLVVVLRQQTGGLPPAISDVENKSEAVSPPPESPPRREGSALQDSSAAKIQLQQLESVQPQAAPRAAPEFAPPPAAPAAALAAPEQDAAAEQAVEQEEMRLQQGRRDAAVGAAAASRAKAKASADSRRSAAGWIARIRALKEDGEIAEAREQLGLFQTAHPDAQVPEDLRSLLRPVTPPTP